MNLKKTILEILKEHSEGWSYPQIDRSVYARHGKGGGGDCLAAFHELLNDGFLVEVKSVSSDKYERFKLTRKGENALDEGL